jgi:hypothetical protein
MIVLLRIKFFFITKRAKAREKENYNDTLLGLVIPFSLASNKCLQKSGQSWKKSISYFTKKLCFANASAK